MNIKDYISSGIIESYVLDLASADERMEFEQLCRQHPELVDARNAFEVTLEKYVLANTAITSPGLKEKLIDAIRATPVTEARLVSMDNVTTTPARSASPLRWVAAASVILLLGAAYFSYEFYTRNQELQSKVAQMENEKKWNDEVQQMMSNPNVAVVNLVGIKASANVYWDTTASDVYLVVKNMPQLPSDKQYQLWSIINGPAGELQPTSMGLFDIGKDGKVILKMTNTKKADAFAITIETRGNKAGPTLEQLQSMGKTEL